MTDFTALNPVAAGVAAYKAALSPSEGESSTPEATSNNSEGGAIIDNESSDTSTGEDILEDEGGKGEEEGKPSTPKRDQEAPELVEAREKAARTAKALQKRIKQESDRALSLQAKINELQGEGIELAREVIRHKNAGDVHSMLKAFGLDGNDVLKFYAGYLDDPEVVKQIGAQKSVEKNMKKAEIDKREAEIAARETKLMRESYATEARGIINKFSDRIPVVAAMQAVMDGKLEDQLISTITQLYNTKDPDILGCKDFPSAVRKILPKFEADFRKKYKPLIDAFSKVDPKVQKQDKQPGGKPEEKKPVTTAKTAEPKKVVPAPKRGLTGTPTKDGPTPPNPFTRSRDAIADSIRAFKNAGG